MSETDFTYLIGKARNILIVSSFQFDLDSLTSGLLLKKYLETLNKHVEYVYPKTLSDDERSYSSHLPYFNEIVQEDSRDYFNKPEFDTVILTDGNNWDQFYYGTTKSAPQIPIQKSIISVDHHQAGLGFAVNLAISDIKACSTIEVLLDKVIPMNKITPEMATLAYAGIVNDTGNFKWNFTGKSLKIAGELLEKGAQKATIINKMFAEKKKEYLSALSYAISNLEYDDELGTVFLFLPFEKLQLDNYAGQNFNILHNAFIDEISLYVSGYPLGILVAEYKGKNTIKISSRGNNLNNKINLPELYKSIGGSGYGHFHVSGMTYEGNFEVLKTTLKDTIRNKLAVYPRS